MTWDSTVRHAAEIGRTIRRSGIRASVHATRGMAGAQAFWIEVSPRDGAFTMDEMRTITDATGVLCGVYGCCLTAEEATQ